MLRQCNIYTRVLYFSALCISDHRISNPNPNPNPDPSPDHDYSHLLVRDAVVRNAVGRKGVYKEYTLWESWPTRVNLLANTIHHTNAHILFYIIVMTWICMWYDALSLPEQKLKSHKTPRNHV